MAATNRIHAFLTIAFLSFTFASGAVLNGQDEPNPYTINVRVGLAVLPVSVTDHKNHRVSGLKKENFHVYEDGRPQTITLFEDKDAPVTVGLVVDNSLSMEPKRPAVIAAALAFAGSSNPQDEIFVVNFNQAIHVELPQGVPFTRNPGELRSALSNITASGQTALYDAIAVALEHLKQGTGGKKYLIVVSDGGDDASRHSLSDTLAMAKSSDAAIYTVAIVNENFTDENPGVLKKLSKATGGEFFLPDSVSEVVDTLKLIARDIRQQYTLGYVPDNQEPDGKFRSIRVTASAPDGRKLSVRTRAGYLAPTLAPERVSVQERHAQ
ncbi:MAG TPA: VWA domain-containing protein [Terriglobia bacterium]|nr:VWA domain-containing protein [Terriglobia bacterium]